MYSVQIFHAIIDDKYFDLINTIMYYQNKTTD